jgi:NitT/TauT family transport system substrate-binding protein
MRIIAAWVGKLPNMLAVAVVFSLMGFLLACGGSGQEVVAPEPKKTYKIAWSHYTAWEILDYISQKGLLDRWAKKYDVNVELVLVNDYIESLSSYTSGVFDGVMSTNMDALTIPAASGVDSTALFATSFSNGNDGIVARGYNSVAELKGNKVNLVEYSVSHYLFSRALHNNGLTEADVQTINTSESDIDTIFLSSESAAALVTWNPILVNVKETRGAKVLYDSSSIPGEIVELMFVNNDVPEDVRMALTGAWYEAVQAFETEQSSTGDDKVILQALAASSGGSVESFNKQLQTTHLFSDPKSTIDFVSSAEFMSTMNAVRKFCFDKGLFGMAAETEADIGMLFPDGSTSGNADSLRLRFTDKYMRPYIRPYISKVVTEK